MTDVRWTPQQFDAVTRMGQGIAVSAAAGSGKTAVLTQRCVHLVCDAAPPNRCNIDQLAVVTFTEAAAAEMKTRIRQALTDRAITQPNNDRIREQLALLDAANISTLHAFCSRLVRQYFNLADIDPSAGQLADDEMRLLQAECLDELMNELYADESPAGVAFRKLVDVYGLGSDKQIADFVIKLSNFLDSLPDPDQWLDDQRNIVTAQPQTVLSETLQALATEISIQSQQTIPPLTDKHEAAQAYLIETKNHVEQLQQWSKQAQELLNAPDGYNSCDSIDAFLNTLRDYEPRIAKPPRLKKNETTHEVEQQRDWARSIFNRSRKLYASRVQKRFTLFTTTELIDGFTQTASYIHTLANLAQQFRVAYTHAKRTRNLIDFADLERLALRVLNNEDIATTIRHKFAHVLVDEYQDINPIQHAILQRVSRETETDRPANLFTVGDVKQSIYGFRSADPEVFQTRLTDSQNNDRLHTIHLQENFRSRPHVIDAINLFFANLMQPAIVGMPYDDNERMHATRENADQLTTDIHFLERNITITDDDDDDQQDDAESQKIIDPDDPAGWETIEREAFLIATEIRNTIDSNVTRDDGQPLTFADFAILLRSGIHTANTIAAVLEKFGIPTTTKSETNLLETTEVRDVLAALQTIDNSQQDLPLAAILRSNVLSQPFNEDELAAIRFSNRAAPFHTAALEFPTNSPDHPVAKKLANIWNSIDRWRHNFRELPIHDALWSLINDTGYLAYVGGLPNGAQRRANLISLHERAVAFSQHKRASLHDFLDFIDQLVEQENAPSTKSPTADANAVYIMTIHAAKGLEFPVVFVADLARRFNKTDTHGRIIHDRQVGIAQSVIDTDQRIEYPSARSHIVANNIHRQAIAEEIRILYVAMTRAKEKLVLVATPTTKFENIRSDEHGASKLSALDLISANNYCDWIVGCLRAFAPTDVSWPTATTDSPIIRIQKHSHTDINSWDTRHADQHTGSTKTQLAAAKLQPLPPTEPRSDAAAILERINHEYPYLAASSIRSVVAASDANFSLDPLVDPQELIRPEKSQTRLKRDRDESANTGIATHKLMQHYDFQSNDAPATQLQRLVNTGILTTEQADLIDTAAIEWFTTTDLANKIRTANDNFHREFMFLAAQPAYRFDETLPESLNDSVLVRGVVDGILVDESGLDIIDYKTDRIDASNMDAKVEQYRSQMNLYASSIAPLFNKTVRSCNLVFLHPRVIIDITPTTDPS